MVKKAREVYLRKVNINNGGSFVLTLPRMFARELGLGRGDYVKMQIAKSTNIESSNDKGNVVILRKANVR